MNLHDAKYQRFSLVREMLETPEIIRRFDFAAAADAAQAIRQAGKLFLTGEGSSRIFPAKNTIYECRRRGSPLVIATEGARQAHEYPLGEFVVFGASNSGKTKEVISLFTQLAQQGHQKRFGLTAGDNTKLESLSNRCYRLSCGPEKATAATKSVVEQALFFRSLLEPWERDGAMAAHRARAADAARAVLETELDPAMVQAVAAAPMLYFAGRNNGVAEELTLKTNEITHKKSDYLEGTYAVHGIEEVMRPEEVLIVVDPFPEEIDKFTQELATKGKMKIMAIASRETGFPTIRVPDVPGYGRVLELLAGWNLLVHVGVALGVNLDKADRARKVGNIYG